MSEFLTSILVVLTAIYVWLTYRIASANKKAVAAMQDQVQASVRPYVYFDLDPWSNVIIEAKLRNSGATAAHNISVRTEPELRSPYPSGQDPKINLTAHKTSLLVPGREIVEFVGTWPEIKAYAPDLVFTGVVAYEDHAGLKYEERFRIDLSARSGMAHIGHPEIGSELQKISETLSKISECFGDVRKLMLAERTADKNDSRNG